MSIREGNILNEPQENHHSDDNNGNKKKPILFYIIAFTVILGLSTFLMMRFYSVSEYSPEGEQLTLTLSDGTKVILQSESSITYFPLWWSFSRKIVLAGEAYFDVVVGKELKVLSPAGRTVVNNCNFKISARDFNYQVTCFEGIARVYSFTNNTTILKPNNIAVVVNGEIKVSTNYGDDDYISSNVEVFEFNSTPFQDVLSEIENHFDVVITSSIEVPRNYSGNITKDKSVEEILYIVCKSYGLTFVVLSEKKYHIIRV